MTTALSDQAYSDKIDISNHPLLIATKKIAPALAAGNSIVLKPSELTPITSILLGKIFKDAGRKVIPTSTLFLV